MLKLFQSIFGAGEAQGRYPESLIEAAIERAVDGTDPRLRSLPRYRKQLRPAVLQAVDHVVAMIDSFPAAQAADRNGSVTAYCSAQRDGLVSDVGARLGTGPSD